VLALITLIVTASAYIVLINFSAAFLSDGVRTMLDWVFILGILAAAVWLVWALFHNSEAVMEAIGKSGKAKTG
jgi:small neutral amino acid transporter SnatA (MarC family)